MDLEYDILESLSGEPREKPRMSILEYSEAGELIYADYSELDEFLEKDFIPRNVIKRRHYDWMEEEYDYYFSIKLGRILSLKLNGQEFIHVMEYLNQLGIRVAGEDPVLCGEFENYDYRAGRSRGNDKSCQEKILSSQEESKLRVDLLREYQEKKTLTLRNELVCLHIKLVKKIAYEYTRQTGVSMYELESYGYEGLISAIENYSSIRGSSFAHYASSVIRGYMFKGVANYYGYYRGQRNFYWLYLSYKKKAEEICQCTLKSEPDVVISKILDLLIQDEKISVVSREEYRNLILLNSPELVQTDIPFEESEKGELLEDTVLACYFQQDLEASLLELSDRELKIIESFFGLYDGKRKTLEELGLEYQVSRARVGQIKNEALKKLKKSKSACNLKEYL